MKIVSAFTDNGVPKTGLTPTLRVRKLSDNSLVVTDANMSEVGDGFYQYDFTTYTSLEDYTIRSDGGITLSNTDRYQFGTDENKSDSILAGERFDNASAKVENDVLTVYDNDGTIQDWDLTDASGTPASIGVYNRTAQ